MSALAPISGATTFVPQAVRPPQVPEAGSRPVDRDGDHDGSVPSQAAAPSPSKSSPSKVNLLV